MSIRGTVTSWLMKVAMVFGEKLLLWFVGEYLNKEAIIEAIDGGLDFLEDLAAKTETDIDDKALRLIREALDIPDNDEPEDDDSDNGEPDPVAPSSDE